MFRLQNSLGNLFFHFVALHLTIQEFLAIWSVGDVMLPCTGTSVFAIFKKFRAALSFLFFSCGGRFANGWICNRNLLWMRTH